jgi:hypothetical protein
MHQNIRKQLTASIKLNPFNDQFDINHFNRLFEDYHNELPELTSIASAFFILNNFHGGFYKQLAELIKSADNNINKVVDLIFAGFNRNYLVDQMKTHEENTMEEEFNHYEPCRCVA